VAVFLEICASESSGTAEERSIINMGFYVCDQLLNHLEGIVDYGDITKLLTMREEMRFKIHHPDED
jgi:hypothetical protein